mmetsp:Transcript_42762/g.129971  ORF Transcript_42762/g.129971 Transcript_42762/m.129971 type:complete len:230 (+) Transcript_42762:441-1130(+)
MSHCHCHCHCRCRQRQRQRRHCRRRRPCSCAMRASPAERAPSREPLFRPCGRRRRRRRRVYCLNPYRRRPGIRAPSSPPTDRPTRPGWMSRNRPSSSSSLSFPSPSPHLSPPSPPRRFAPPRPILPWTGTPSTPPPPTCRSIRPRSPPATSLPSSRRRIAGAPTRGIARTWRSSVSCSGGRRRRRRWRTRRRTSAWPIPRRRPDARTPTWRSGGPPSRCARWASREGGP